MACRLNLIACPSAGPSVHCHWRARCERAESAIVELARSIVPGVQGAISLDLPKCLVVWIITQTDAEREILSKKSPSLEARFRQILIGEGHPSAAVLHVGLAFQSRETVDRDYRGNVWFATK